MKKIIIAASMLAATFVANAQEPSLKPTKLYKPVAGNVLAEFGLFTGGLVGADVTSLSSSPYGSPQLKFRYFIQDQIALRAGFNYTQKTNSTKINDPAGIGSVKEMSSLFGLNIGIEKHFTGTSRLSTYVGADVSFQKVGVSSTWDNTANGTTFTNGASRKTVGANATKTANGSFGFGLRAVTGADYYFVEKVYLGAELGWGFIASKNDKINDEVTPAGGQTVKTTTNSTGGSFNILPSLTAGLRIGYIF